MNDNENNSMTAADENTRPDSENPSADSEAAADVQTPSGPPVSEEELERRRAAEDALDRDLHSAHRKKLKADAVEKKRLDAQHRKEAEMYEKAARLREKQEQAAAQKKEQEALAAVNPAAAAAAAFTAPTEKNAGDLQTVDGTVSHGTKRVHREATERSFNKTLTSMAAGRFFLLLLVIVAVAYFSAFLYVANINEDIFEELEARLTGQSRIVTDQSFEYYIPASSPLTMSEKTAAGLNPGLIDSDKDGLTDDYEINISLTDPLNPDSDNDSVYDGAELRAELDPLKAVTDGVTPDNKVLRDTIIADEGVSARVVNIPKSAYASLTRVTNNSIQGSPGVVGYAYEFYAAKRFEDCVLTFSYDSERLDETQTAENALTIVRFNDESLKFEAVTSEISTADKTVSAHITENGIYALFNKAVLMSSGKTKVFFLIDNSGSMYPEELCAGSEENDVEFKRLDFALNLMDKLGDDVQFGAGEFSGSYSNVAPISPDKQSVKDKIDALRNKSQIFSGTEITGALSQAIKEFGTSTVYDRNYIILLTDGISSSIVEARDQAALNAAKNANVTVFTIGLGKYIDADYLYNIARETNGQFFQASNADALEDIYDKISSFMSYNQVTLEEDTGKKGYIVADSGFNVLRDGIGYQNFRADFAPNGADVGISGLIRAYYRGELALQADSYSTDYGKVIDGYDISGATGFSDGKIDLKNVQIDILQSYNDYLKLSDKWNYHNIKGGTLYYTNDTRSFIENAGLKVITSSYDFDMPEESDFVKFLRVITFNQIRPFTQYECVLIDSSLCQGDDKEIMKMINWYCNIPNSHDKCRIYDFGYEGDEAFDALFNELTTGSPAVITCGGSAMNAVRIFRDIQDPNQFILDAYDSNSPERTTRINLQRTPIYHDDGSITYQISATLGTTDVPLKIIVMD